MGTPMEELRKMLDLQIELNKSIEQSNLELLSTLDKVKNELNEAKEEIKKLEKQCQEMHEIIYPM